HPFLEHRLHAVADDRDHVAVFDDLELVADAAPAGNDAGAAFGELFGDGDVDDAIERFDHAVDVTAALQIDLGHPRRVEDVAGGDDVGATEPDHHVAVGMRRRLVNELDAFAVEVQVFFAL